MSVKCGLAAFQEEQSNLKISSLSNAFPIDVFKTAEYPATVKVSSKTL